MRKQITTALSSTILGVTCLIGLPSTALAIDGVILIDQNHVIAAGGFPYRITQPGSYQLAGNLMVPDATSGIEIRAANVTLNLNGFSILGHTVCTIPDEITVCKPTSSDPFGVLGSGILGFTDNVTVLNGTVQGMGSTGINLSEGSRVENMRVVSNGGDGIVLNNGSGTLGSTVTGNIVSLNGGSGIVVQSAGTVLNNTISFNGGIGLNLNAPSSGYAFNVLRFNAYPDTPQVQGGIQTGSNVCNNALCK